MDQVTFNPYYGVFAYHDFFKREGIPVVEAYSIDCHAVPVEPWERLRQNSAAHREALAEAHGEIELDVPIMRTLFAHPDAGARDRVREGLERQASMIAQTAMRRAAPTSVDDFALVGEPAEVADGIAHWREELSVTHLIARTQMPGAEESEILASLEHLAEICPRSEPVG